MFGKKKKQEEEEPPLVFSTSEIPWEFIPLTTVCTGEVGKDALKHLYIQALQLGGEAVIGLVSQKDGTHHSCLYGTVIMFVRDEEGLRLKDSRRYQEDPETGLYYVAPPKTESL